MINRLKAKFQKGFTLIETMVAVLILATAIAGPLTIASKGLSTALVAKDQTTAYYLAQDAIEYLRFARDTNTLAGNNWLMGAGSGSTDLAPCVSTDGSAFCYFDSLANSPIVPTVCTSGICPKMYFDSSNQYFTYNTNTPNTPSPFTRMVSVQTPVAGQAGEASTTVTVKWTDGPGVVHTITVRESLFNWQ